MSAASPADAPAPGGRARSARRQFTRTILVLEVFVVGFAALVAHGLRAAEPGPLWALTGAVVASLVLAAGVVGRPGGYVVGSVLQVAVLAGGLLVPMMWLVGGVFAVLWVVALRLGGRIDAERAERAEQGGPDAVGGQ